MSTDNPTMESLETNRRSAIPERNVKLCNFRQSTNLSNESSRVITAMFERYAANISKVLEAYLGANFLLRLLSIRQSTVQEYVADSATDTYLVPCGLGIMDAGLLLKMDTAIVFPIIDLLLGGVGAALPEEREMSDLEESILESVFQILIKELDSIWSSLKLTYQPLPGFRSAALASHFLADEQLVVTLFSLEVGDVRAGFQIVLSTSFVSYLIRHLSATASPRIASRDDSRRLPFRQRILACQFLLSADVTQMRVSVKDLVDIVPGKVICMRAPIRRAGCLTVEGIEVMKAIPVRNGAVKAAQIVAMAGDSITTE